MNGSSIFGDVSWLLKALPVVLFIVLMLFVQQESGKQPDASPTAIATPTIDYIELVCRDRLNKNELPTYDLLCQRRK